MSLAALRRRCEARLRTLDLPVPFDVRTLCDALAAGRQRPILLQPISSPAGPSGLCLALPAADIILYEQQTSPLHQQQIILHELCHLLCGHRPAPAGPHDVPQAPFLHLSAEAVQRLLRRAGYSAEDEREAELLASLILERVRETPRTAIGAASPEDAGVLRGLAVCLEGRDPDAPRSPA